MLAWRICDWGWGKESNLCGGMGSTLCEERVSSLCCERESRLGTGMGKELVSLIG